MAERRMFAKTIIDSDAFIDMPVTARLLYYDFGMRADDDGFVNSPKKIMRMVGASQDDLAILISKKFIIPFDTGVVVIKHWRIHNYIRQDRKHNTKYESEFAQLLIKDNGAYSLSDGHAEVPQIDSEPYNEETADEEETLRQKAYRESTLPYSFSYKIRNAFFGKTCPICGKTMNSEYLCLPTIQHNVPISKGGKHELGNISVICQSCNASIQDKETGELNAKEVIDVWDEICRSNVSQLTVDCPTEVSLGKDRLGKDSLNNRDVDEVIDYLNMRTGSKYRHSESSRKNIRARLNDGFTVQECKDVIDKKCVEWVGTEYEKYLNTETLFRPSHFEKYLNQKAVQKKGQSVF